jgi:hypothetical protein
LAPNVVARQRGSASSPFFDHLPELRVIAEQDLLDVLALDSDHERCGLAMASDEHSIALGFVDGLAEASLRLLQAYELHRISFVVL